MNGYGFTIRRCVFAVAIPLAVAGLVLAQVPAIETSDKPTARADWPRGSQGTLRFFVDAASFRGVQGFALQEFYTLLDARQLQFVPESSSFAAQIDISISITDDTGQIAGEEMWTRNLSVPNLRELRETGGVVRDQIGFSLKPGNYRVKCEVEDIYGDRIGKIETALTVADYETAGLASSSVLFASSLERAESDHRFVRNGWEVVPRVTRIFSLAEPIRFYHEIYNFSPGSDPGAFDIRYQLLGEANVPVVESVDHRFKKGGESAVLIDSIGTAGLAPGPYVLNVQALDLDGKSRASRKQMVYLQSEGGEVEELTEDQRTSLSYYRHIKWLAEESALKTYEALKSLEARDKFLKVFWRRVDPTPGTDVNEKLIEHIRRMRYSQNNFSGGHQEEGYDTDKGRVYVTYGGPSDRDYRSAVDSIKPYEIWTYEEKGTYEFIFRDRRGIGVYELVHSTYPGELYNPNWQNEL